MSVYRAPSTVPFGRRPAPPPTATPANTGDVAVTLGACTASADGALAITGETSPTLGAVTSSATGALAIAGETAVTLGAVTASAAGGATATVGEAANTLGAITASATGALALAGAFAVTIGAATLAAAGALAIVAESSNTLGAVTSSATGVTSRTGDATPTLGAVTLAASGAATNPFPYAGAHGLSYQLYGNVATSISAPSVATDSYGNTVVVAVGRGDISSHAVPTDNKGNTYGILGTSHAYTNWPTSGPAVYAAQNAKGGSGHVVTVSKASGDEVTIAMVEVVHGKRVVDHQWNEVLTPSALTSQSVTVTGPATLIAIIFGDGSLGQTHEFTPNNGFTVVEAVTLDDVIVQCTVATKDVTLPGTYNVTWTPTNAEGGLLWLIAVDAAPLGAVTLSATGQHDGGGSLAATLGAVASTSAAALALVGAASVTIGAVTSAASAALAIAGDVAVTLGAATLAATAGSLASAVGDISATLGGIALTAAGERRMRRPLQWSLRDLKKWGRRL